MSGQSVIFPAHITFADEPPEMDLVPMLPEPERRQVFAPLLSTWKEVGARPTFCP